MPLRAALIRFAALASLPFLGAGEARAWTVSKASACNGTSTYQYSHQVTIVTGSTAQNTYMSVSGEWWPSPKFTTVHINTFGKGSVTVQRLCKTDPWASGDACTGNKVTAQTNSGWGLANVLKAAPDALAPKGILAPPPAKVPVPSIYSEKWGGGGLPLAINVAGTGPRCSLRIDEVRDPNGLVGAIGPTAVKAGGAKFQLTQAAFQQKFQKSGTYAIRSRLRLWTGGGWLEGEWSPWYGFPFAVAVKGGLKQPPGNVKQIPPPPPPKP
jgi:hypothetical protein